MARKRTTTAWAGSWMRNVVPEGYEEATLRIQGTSPLLHNSADADPDSEMFRSFVHLTQKKKKSLDDEARIRELEWQLRIYLDDDLGPYVPGRWIHANLRDSASKWRKGATVTRSLVVVPTRIALEYEGPRTQSELWNERNSDGSRRFAYTTMVANAGFGSGRVRRCRPCFPEWAVTVEIAFDPEELDFDLLGLVVERSQRFGLGDYRPTFGGFAATLERGPLHKSEANGRAAKDRDATHEHAHSARVDRIRVGSA